MSLGKRQLMKRTTSMTGITVDIDHHAPPTLQPNDHEMGSDNWEVKNTDGFDMRYLSIVSPRNPSTSSADFLIKTAPFLRACSLCKRRLGTGRDIYMYRGEDAFCSQECRQQQMNHDERKEKCSLTSIKKGVASTPVS